MTEIVVAKRSGVLRAPDGAMYRLKGGATLADARHPAVAGSPDSWRPVAVHLPYDGAEEPAPPGASAEGMLATLERVVELLDGAGLLPDDVDRDREGWLVEALTATLAAEAPRAGHTNDEIRKWARLQGIEVPARGRIPSAVREAYEASHGLA